MVYSTVSMFETIGGVRLLIIPTPMPDGFIRQNNYQYYFGVSLFLKYIGPQNPILIIKAPIVGSWVGDANL